MPGVSVRALSLASSVQGFSAARDFDVYVDSSGGSDLHAGTTEAGAFQSLSAATAAALAFGNGVKVGVKYGSAWRDRLNLATLNGVTVAAFGDPADGLPLARPDDIITGWLDNTDRGDANTAVYSKLVTWAGNSNFVMAWEDDVPYTYVASLALCQSTAGSFYLPTLNTSLGTPGNTQILYVHPYGNTNAKTDGKKREFTTRDYGFIAGDDSTFTHLYSYRGAGQYGGAKLGDNALMDRCLSSEGIRHGLLINSGRFYRCGSWMKHRAYTDKIGIEAYRDNGAGYGILFEECVTVSEITTFLENGIGGHTSGTPYDTWEYRQCSVQGCAMVQADAKTVTAKRSKLDKGYLHTESEGAGGTSLIQDTWVLHVPTITNFHFAIRVVGSNPATVEGTRAYFTADQYDNGLIYWETATGAVTLKRNVIVDNQAGTTRRRVFFGGGPATNATFTGNIVDSRGTNPAAQEVYAIWMSPTGATWTADNNVWRDAVANSNSVRFLLNGASYLTPATYFTAVRPTKEANSVNTNPQITGAATFDFTVNAVSGMPANIGLERDPTCQNYTAIPASLQAMKDWVLAA